MRFLGDNMKITEILILLMIFLLCLPNIVFFVNKNFILQEKILDTKEKIIQCENLLIQIKNQNKGDLE